MAAPAQTTEEKTFRLLGLRWSGMTADDASVKEAVKALLSDQGPDGGWAQIPSRQADAYATGQALVALQEGGLTTDSAAYRRGVDFLLQSQEEDGSWHVRSRAIPFQGYIKTGFPHGKDQFISATGTGWAATALALSMPAPKETAQR